MNDSLISSSISRGRMRSLLFGAVIRTTICDVLRAGNTDCASYLLAQGKSRFSTRCNLLFLNSLQVGIRARSKAAAALLSLQRFSASLRDTGLRLFGTGCELFWDADNRR